MSSHLQTLHSQDIVSVETFSSQIPKIEKIARVKGAEIVQQQLLDDDKVLLTLLKK